MPPLHLHMSIDLVVRNCILIGHLFSIEFDFIGELLHQGKMAKDLTGNPEAFSALGTMLKITAPFAGT